MDCFVVVVVFGGWGVGEGGGGTDFCTVKMCLGQKCVLGSKTKNKFDIENYAKIVGSKSAEPLANKV